MRQELIGKEIVHQIITKRLSKLTSNDLVKMINKIESRKGNAHRRMRRSTKRQGRIRFKKYLHYRCWFKKWYRRLRVVE